MPNTDTQSSGEPSGHKDLAVIGSGTLPANWAVRPDVMRVSHEEGVAQGTHRGVVQRGEARKHLEMQHPVTASRGWQRDLPGISPLALHPSSRRFSVFFALTWGRRRCVMTRVSLGLVGVRCWAGKLCCREGLSLCSERELVQGGRGRHCHAWGPGLP